MLVVIGHPLTAEPSHVRPSLVFKRNPDKTQQKIDKAQVAAITADFLGRWPWDPSPVSAPIP